MICCKEFDNDIKDGVFTKDAKNTFFVTLGLAAGVKFCPFCGKSSVPRFSVERSDQVLNWLVRDYETNRNVAFFDCQVHAKEYTEKLNDVL